MSLPSYLPAYSGGNLNNPSKKNLNADNGKRLKIFSCAAQVCCIYLVWLKAASFQRQRSVNACLLTDTDMHRGFAEAGLRQLAVSML